MSVLTSNSDAAHGAVENWRHNRIKSNNRVTAGDSDSVRFRFGRYVPVGSIKDGAATLEDRKVDISPGMGADGIPQPSSPFTDSIHE